MYFSENVIAVLCRFSMGVTFLLEQDIIVDKGKVGPFIQL
jgi:hypothetical protein